MTSPSRVRPHNPGNIFLGRRPAEVSPEDARSSQTRLQALGGINTDLATSQQNHFQQAAGRILRTGADTHRRSLFESPQFQVSSEQYDERLQEALGWTQSGHRTGYPHSLSWLFLLIENRLENPALRNRATTYTERFVQMTGQYREFLQGQQELSPIQKFRYLHSTARLTRTLLAQLEQNSQFANEHSETVQHLRQSLRHVYTELLDYAQSASISDPNATHIAPLIEDIRMRQALLDGNDSAARSHGFRIIRYYQEHPLPGRLPETGEQRWVFRAGLETMEDGIIPQLIPEMHRTSPAEQSQIALNGLATELVIQVAASIDAVNEEEPTTIQNRYRAYSAITAALTVRFPGRSLEQINLMLTDPDQNQAIFAAVNRVRESQPRVASILDEVREQTGAGDVGALIRQAKFAAIHIRSLQRGPGSTLLNLIFHQVQSPIYNRIARVQAAIENHPQIVTDLELSVDPNDYEAAALELLRTGQEALPILARYQESLAPNQRGGAGSIAAALSQNEDIEFTLNQFLRQLIEQLNLHLHNQPDHVVAGASSCLHFLSGLEELAPDVSLDETNRNQILNGLHTLDSWGYATERAWHHISQPSSLASLAAGALAFEWAAGAMLSRAGAAGELGFLVGAGEITAYGRFGAGAFSGTAMSVVGTSFHHLERHEMGLATTPWMIGRDMATSTAFNMALFGGTALASRGLARLLAPEAGVGAETAAAGSRGIGRLGFWRGTALYGGTLLTGAGLATGGGMLLRGVQNNDWSFSRQEAVENLMMIASYEAMAFGLRWARRRVGVPAELRNTPYFEAMTAEQHSEFLNQRATFEPTNLEGHGPIFRAMHAVYRGLSGEALLRALGGNRSETTTSPAELGRVNRFAQGVRRHISRFFANRFNEFSTVLGEHRVRQINDFTDAMIESNPDFTHYRDLIRYNLALREAAAPGSLNELLARNNENEGEYTYLSDYHPSLDFETGVPRFRFIEGPTPEAEYIDPTPDGFSESLQQHLENIVPGSGRISVLAEINGEMGQVLRIYYPGSNNHEILGLGREPELESWIQMDPQSIDASVDTIHRQLVLPPREAGGDPIRISYGEAMDHYSSEQRRSARFSLLHGHAQSNPQNWTPFSWNIGLLSHLRNWFHGRSNDGHPMRVSGREEQVNRAMQRLAGQLENHELPRTVQVVIETGNDSNPRIVIINPLENGHSQNLPTRRIILQGRVDPHQQRIILPPIRGQEGEVILDFANGEIRQGNHVIETESSE